VKRVVECVPNFSEGRRPEIIAQIVHMVEETADVKVLDTSSDPAHNRTVLTFIGSPKGVADAAFAAIAKAAELIDMDSHTGEHPRMGATDVLPFVPIAGVSMDDCVQIARQVGARVGEELGIPVYLYQEAATRPEWANLGALRPKSHQYEQKKADVGSDAKWDPDFGPHRVGKAGATAIGARPPLIAYNVYLTTDDVDIAERVARAIRHSSGGLAFVKARGFLVDGKAQVSMNLTDFRRTPIHRVVEMVRREAGRYGVSIERSELVGLIPQQALVDAAVWYLQLDDFDAQAVLENRI
jgi:glutamate formiminotransferase / formiminotetrahydrofolate cyclodeaminase